MRALLAVIALGLGALGEAAATPTVDAPDPEAPRVVRHRLPWPGLGRTVRVAHLSDLHVGRFTPRARLEAAILAARAAKPDLTVLTGDYLNRSLQHARELRAHVARLPRPCLAVLGNHDHWSGAAGVKAALRRAGAIVLANQSQLVRGRGFELTVVGIDDAYTAHHSIRDAFAGLARPRDALVLMHYPAIAEAVARVGGRLLLSGHTHGERAVRRRYLHGFHDLSKSAQLYVNPGVGSGRARPRRVAPELTIFELSSSATTH